MASGKKEVKQLLAEAREQGWRVEERKHFILYSPDGRGIVVCPKTPSDTRSLKNVISQMRRYGFVWKGH